MSLFYRFAYLVGFKPWDSGKSPPELVAEVEGADALPAGRALDLGCGTGTNSVYLASHGWEVTGIDLVGRAVAAARRKARAASVSPRLLHGDVTHLGELSVGQGYGLVLDLGCFHSIPAERREAYAEGVTRAAAPGAILLLFGFAPGAMRLGPAGVTAGELGRRLEGWELVSSTRGTDRIETCWYRLRRLP